MVTSVLQEEQAIDFIREGGDDSIDKVQLSRLGAAVNAALARRTRTTGPGKTERQQAKRMELFQACLESSPDGMLALDEHGYIMHINEIAGRLLSGKAWTPAGNLVWEVFPALSGSFFDAAFQAVLKDAQPLTIRMYLECTDAWIDCIFQPISHGMTILIREVSREEELRERFRELEERFQQELDLTSALAAEHERHLLGQELHDNVNQLLASANLFLSLIREQPGRVTELLPYCMNSLSKAIEENRRIARGLVSADPASESLLQHAKQLCDTLLLPAGVACEIHDNNFTDTTLPPAIHVALYRILQEHCSNISRHANASRVALNFEMQDMVIRVSIADNGQGSGLTREHDGIGLRNISRRARELGGHIHISTSPGNGFVLQVSVPVPVKG
jgi:signal transduction histidine kinase